MADSGRSPSGSGHSAEPESTTVSAVSASVPNAVVLGNLTRPLISIEDRTPQEVFDIMVERVRGTLRTMDWHGMRIIVPEPKKPEPHCEPVAFDDGEWSEWLHPSAPSFFSQCCDCGLIHEMEFEIVPRAAGNIHLNPGESDNGVIIFRVRRSGASAIEARQRLDQEDGLDPKGESATREAGDAQKEHP